MKIPRRTHKPGEASPYGRRAAAAYPLYRGAAPVTPPPGGRKAPRTPRILLLAALALGGCAPKAVMRPLANNNEDIPWTVLTEEPPPPANTRVQRDMPDAGDIPWAVLAEEPDPPAAVLPVAAANTQKQQAKPDAKVVDIKEKLFIAQVNDVYLNTQHYEGKTIKLEGLFKSLYYEDISETHCFVVRYGPGGCCGNDGVVGFEVAWNQEGRAYPQEDAWVEAAGVLNSYSEYGFPYIYLTLSSLTVKAERGAEFVQQ